MTDTTPTFTVTLGADFLQGMGGQPNQTITVTLTPNVHWVIWESRLKEVRSIGPVVPDQDGNVEVDLLANDDGLSVSGIQWLVDIRSGSAGLKKFWIDARAAGVTLDLSTVTPAPGSAPVADTAGLSLTQLLAMLKDGASPLSEAVEDIVDSREVATVGDYLRPPKGIGTSGATITITPDAPTYTAAKNVSYAAFIPDEKVRVGGIFTDYFGNGQNNINGAVSQDYPGWTAYEIEFMVSGQYCSVYTYDVNRADFQIFIDDVQFYPSWQEFAADGTAYHVKFDFGANGPLTHRVRMLMPGNAVIQSIWLPGVSDIWAAPQRKRLLITGDSYVQGPTGTTEGALMGGTVAGQLALRMGWEVWNFGQGGTGPASDGGGANGISAYGSVSRLAAYATAPEMDLMMVYGAINDGSLGVTVSVNASKALWQAMKSARPDTPLVVVGPEPGSPADFDPAISDALNVGMKAAAEASEYVDLYIDQRTNNWVTGTGHVGAEAHDGNADFYISSDGIHPTHAGFANIVDHILLELPAVVVPSAARALAQSGSLTLDDMLDMLGDDDSLLAQAVEAIAEAAGGGIALSNAVSVVAYSGSLTVARPAGAAVVYWSGFPSAPTNAQAQDIIATTTPSVASTISSSGLGNSLWAAGHAEVVDRNDLGTVAPASGELWLSYFTAPVANTIVKLGMGTGGVAAVGVTLAKLALFTVADDGTLAMVARTASTTTLGTATYADYAAVLATAGGFPASYTFVPGQRYAFGWLIVATTPCNLRGRGLINAGTPPMMSRFVAAQTDIATTYTPGSSHYQQAYLMGLSA